MACIIKTSPEYKSMLSKVGSPILAEYYLSKEGPLQPQELKVFNQQKKEISQLKRDLGIYSMKELSNNQKINILKNVFSYNKQHNTSHSVLFNPIYPSVFEITGIITSYGPTDRPSQIERQLDRLDPDQDTLFKSQLNEELDKLRGGQLSMFNREIEERFISAQTLRYIANKLKNRSGVNYEIISEEKAKQLSNTYKGEGAFYLGKNVYFVEGHFTLDNVFHEFSHPFVRALFKYNNEFFQNLFKKIQDTQEGQSIIKIVEERYPEYLTNGVANTPLFYEEVIVRAITKYATENINPETGKPFISAIKRILRELGNLIKRLFNITINISELDPNTSLRTLAEIISAKTNKINLVPEETTSQKGETNIVFNRTEPETTREATDRAIARLGRTKPYVIEYEKINTVLDEGIDELSGLNQDVLNDIPKLQELVNTALSNIEAWEKIKKKRGVISYERHVAEDLQKSVDVHEYFDALLQHIKDISYRINGGVRVYAGVRETSNGILAQLESVKNKIQSGDFKATEEARKLTDIRQFVNSYKNIFESLSTYSFEEHQKGKDIHPGLDKIITNSLKALHSVESSYIGLTREIIVKALGPYFSTKRNVETILVKGKEVRLMPKGKNVKKLTLHEMLTDMNDITAASMVLDSLAESNSEFLQIIDKWTKGELEKSRITTLNLAKDLLAACNGVTNYDFSYERLDGKLTGNITSMYNRAKVSKDMKQFFAENPDIEKSQFATELEYANAINARKRKIAEFYNKHTKRIPFDMTLDRKNMVHNFELNIERLGDEFEDIKNIVRRKRSSLNDFAYMEWVNNTIRVTYEQMEVEGTLENRKISFYGGDLMVPSDKYLNPAYTKLSVKQKEILGLLAEAKWTHDALLGIQGLSHFEMPQMRKDMWETAESVRSLADIKKIWNKIGEGFTVNEQDVEKVVVETEDFLGNKIRELPVYWTRSLPDMEKLSTDALGTIITYMSMAQRHYVLSQSVDVMNMIKSAVDENIIQIRERDPMGRLVKFKKTSTSKESEIKYKKGSESNVGKMLAHYHDMVWMGHSQKGVGLIKIKRLNGKELTEEDVQNAKKDLDSGMTNEQVAKKYSIRKSAVTAIMNNAYSSHMFIDTAKVVDALLGYTALNQLAANMYAGVGNVLNAVTQQWIESAAKKHFGAKDYAIGNAKYWALLPDFLSQTGKVDNTSFLALWGEYMDVFQEYNVEGRQRKGNRKRLFRMINRNLLMFYTKAGEHFIQTSSSLAMASKYKLHDKNGKESSVLNAMEKKDNKLVCKAEFAEDWNEKRNDFLYKQKRILNELNGIYNEVDKNYFQYQAYGRAIIMYRKFMVPFWNRRMAKQHFDQGLEEWKQGYYLTGVTFLKTLVQMKLAFGKTYNELSPNQKENLNRLLTDMTIIAGLGILLMGMSGDDDDRTYANVLAKYFTRRLFAENTMFVSWSSAKQIVKSPAAGMETMTTLTTIFSWLLIPFNWSYAIEKIKSGRNKGWTRIGAMAIGAIPVVSNVREYKAGKQKLKMYESATMQFN